MDEQQLIELGRRMADAFNASDWESYAAAMTNDTLYVGPRASAKGRAEIMQLTIPRPTGESRSTALYCSASDDGRLIAIREYYDRAGIMAQLGASPPTAGQGR